MKENNKGFTLIELLVVIAIIGILSGIVLTSLNSARQKGADAGVKGNLSSIRTQAEILYDSGSDPLGSYADVCSDNNVMSALTAAKVDASTNCKVGPDENGNENQAWIAWAPISSGVYCVDSRGISAVLAADPADMMCE